MPNCSVPLVMFCNVVRFLLQEDMSGQCGLSMPGFPAQLVMHAHSRSCCTYKLEVITDASVLLCSISTPWHAARAAGAHGAVCAAAPSGHKCEEGVWQQRSPLGVQPPGSASLVPDHRTISTGTAEWQVCVGGPRMLAHARPLQSSHASSHVGSATSPGSNLPGVCLALTPPVHGITLLTQLPLCTAALSQARLSSISCRRSHGRQRCCSSSAYGGAATDSTCAGCSTPSWACLWTSMLPVTWPCLPAECCWGWHACHG